GGPAPEIPRAPTIMAQPPAALEKVPLADVPKYLSDTLEGSARLLKGPALAKTLEAVGPLVAAAQKLLRRLDSEVGPLLVSLRGTSDMARTSLQDVTRQLD